MAKKRFLALKIIGIVILSLGVVYGGFTITNKALVDNLIKYAKSFDKIEYTNQLTPFLDEDNNYSFKTNNDFKIVQLTDIHLGCGFLSTKEDKKALNAIASMITYEKPDLVILTGDNAFPVPYITGTFNNGSAVEVLENLFEKLGVYWTTTFGNHDSELYSYYNRYQIAKKYQNKKYIHSIFRNNYHGKITGEGNQIIQIYNENDLIMKSLFLIDSNAYLPSDMLGIKWEYDNVHEDQMKWFIDKCNENKSYNNSILEKLSLTESEKELYSNPKNFIFQHIPFYEFQQAYDEVGSSESQLIEGDLHENVCYPYHRDNWFNTILNQQSTQGVFVGHDHVNNFTINYKGINLVYGYSIDYVAYDGIDNKKEQRGCTTIKVASDTSYQIHHENYYQDKYVTKYPKENIK